MIEQKIANRQLNTTAEFPLKEQGPIRIVFMGTPEFAVASLDRLVKAGLHVVGVVTAPDKAAGRGMQLQESAVKKYAVQLGLNILQPEKLKNPEFLQQLESLQADLQIVVAFRMLPEVVWNMPPMGTINLHGSLLPQYRGAAPINWAIINGETATGVTTFKLQHEIDTGNILMTAVIAIGEEETAGELHDRMKETGAGLLLDTVLGLQGGRLKEMPQCLPGGDIATAPQENSSLKHAPKISTATCQVNWDQPLENIFNLVRGLSPYPAAFTYLEGKKLKIFKTQKVHQTPAVSPGTFETDQKTFLQFACSDGYLSLKELQLEGKKKMVIEDFLRGYRCKNT